jgi:hypothetical protein
MVLSDRFGGKPRPSIMKQTLLYVLGFGLGSLALVGVLSLTMVAIAEGIMPSDTPAKSTSDKENSDDDTGKAGAAKKPRSKRANEASEDDADTPL